MSKKNQARYGSPFDPKFTGTGKTYKGHGAKIEFIPADPTETKKIVMDGLVSKEKVLKDMANTYSNERDDQFKTIKVDMDTSHWDMALLKSMMEESYADASRFYRGGTVTGRSSSPSSRHMEYQSARNSVKSWIVRADQTGFDEIVGNEAALLRLKDALTAPVWDADLYTHYGMKAPKGALLYGPPGCGKTMFARAAATEMRKLYGAKVEFISLAATELQSGWVGQTEERIKAIFRFARIYREVQGHPLLVFIDEADSLLPARDGGRDVYSWEESRVSTFLAEMDGIRESGAFILLATNRPEAIDQAVLRDGRCDFKIEIARPGRAEAEAILRKQFATLPLADSLDDLVFAGVESLLDPEKIIAEARMIQISKDRTLKDAGGRSFLLEHILSGAMLVSMRQRVAHLAFVRDRAEKTLTGVKVADVISATNDLYAENKGLNHSFALRQFLQGLEIKE